MKLKNFINRIGIDKIAHFGIGGLCAAWAVILALTLCRGVMWWNLFGYGMIGILVAIILSLIKELIDDKFDKWDILAGVLGAVSLLLPIALGALIRVMI